MDDGGTETKRPARRGGGKGQTGEYGSALRSVYQSTVQEEIPNEFLDLLGKLD